MLAEGTRTQNGGLLQLQELMRAENTDTRTKNKITR